MSLTERKVRARCAELGIGIEVVNFPRLRLFEVLLQAPKGRRFQGPMHEQVASNEESMAEAWSLAEAHLLDTEIEDCDDVECDWCCPDAGGQ